MTPKEREDAGLVAVRDQVVTMLHDYRAEIERLRKRERALFEVINGWGYWRDKGGRERCYCVGDADCLDRHSELCDLMNAALAEHEGAEAP